MSNTKNLGQVSGVFIGKSAPNNTTLIWYDDTPSQMCHKIYDSVTNSWKALSPDIVSNTTYSELVSNAQKNGLSVGKHYVITDKSNVLAIAVTATKVQYIDSLGNILIDDLGTNIQYHVSSSNLLIDDLAGVFNYDSNKLVFTFTEQTQIDENEDFFFGKVRRGTKYVLSKFRISSLISKTSDNSISWNKGLFFSFKNAVNKVLNKTGGIVGYDEYGKKMNQIDTSLENVSKNNQQIAENAEKSITDKTADSAIYNKKIQNSIDVASAPGDILKGDTLFIIISKIQRWINRFKYANGISISKNFADAKTQQYINNNDTVESAFAKVQYMLKNPTTSGMLPEGWSTAAISRNGESVEGKTAFQYDGNPKAGDSIFYAFAKIVDFMDGVGKFGKLSTQWSEISNINTTINYPTAGETIDSAFSKLVAKLKQLGDITYGKITLGSTIFDIANGTLKFTRANKEFSQMYSWGLSINSSNMSLPQTSEVGAVAKYLGNGVTLQESEGVEAYFSVNKSKFHYHTESYGISHNGVYSAAYVESKVDTSSSNAAFQAYSTSTAKNTFDAFFSKIKLGTITFNSVYVKTANYYITRDKGLIVWNGDSETNFYLPNNPENGLMILIVQSTSNAINVYAQGNDEIDTINESKPNVSINQRGVIWAFIYVAGVTYSGKNTSGLWHCAKWMSTFS